MVAPSKHEILVQLARQFRLTSQLLLSSSIILLSSVSCTSQAQPQSFAPDRPEKIDGETLQDLTDWIEKYPRNPQPYFQRAHLHQLRDERDNAIDDYTKVIELEPKNAEAYTRRSEMYAMTNKTDEAIADAGKVVSLFPKWASTYDQKARVEWIAGHYHQAIDDSLKALALDPRNGRGLSTLVQSYDELGQHQNAINAATYGIDITEDDNINNLKFAYQDRGLAYIHAHQFEQACEDIRAGLKEKPNDSQLYAYLALAYAGSNRMNDAKDYIAKTMALESFPARGYRLRAEMYRAGGLWQEAVKDYSTSTSLEPTFGPGFMQRAIAEIALGQYLAAKSDLNKAVKLWPSALPYSYLALVKELGGEPGAADEDMAKAFILTPDLPMNYVNRANVYLHRCDLAKAAEDCNQALKLDPYLGDAWFTASLVATMSGQKENAMRFLQMAYQNGWHDQASQLEAAKPCQTDKPIVIVAPEPKVLKPEPFTAVDKDSAP